jgi:hypothetical protein
MGAECMKLSHVASNFFTPAYVVSVAFKYMIAVALA